jgi:Ca2+-binding EF-hand superfamily protein
MDGEEQQQWEEALATLTEEEQFLWESKGTSAESRQQIIQYLRFRYQILTAEDDDGEMGEEMPEEQVEELRHTCLQALENLPEDQREEWQARAEEANSQQLLQLYHMLAEEGLMDQGDGEREQMMHEYDTAATKLQAVVRGRKARKDSMSLQSLTNNNVLEKYQQVKKEAEEEAAAMEEAADAAVAKEEADEAALAKEEAEEAAAAAAKKQAEEAAAAKEEAEEAAAAKKQAEEAAAAKEKAEEAAAAKEEAEEAAEAKGEAEEAAATKEEAEEAAAAAAAKKQAEEAAAAKEEAEEAAAAKEEAEEAAAAKEEAEEVAAAGAEGAAEQQADTIPAALEEQEAVMENLAAVHIQSIVRGGQDRRGHRMEERGEGDAEELQEEEKEAKEDEQEQERAKKEAEEQAKQEAEEQAKQEMEEQAKQKMEEQAKEQAKEEAEEQAKKEAEQQANQEAEEQAKKEAEEQAKKKAEEQAKKEAEEQAKQEAEEQAEKEAEEQAEKEAEEQAKQEAEEQAEKEAEEQARRKVVQLAKAEEEAEEEAARLEEEKMMLEEQQELIKAKDMARQEAEERAGRVEQERARRAEEQNAIASKYGRPPRIDTRMEEEKEGGEEDVEALDEQIAEMVRAEAGQGGEEAMGEQESEEYAQWQQQREHEHAAAMAGLAAPPTPPPASSELQEMRASLSAANELIKSQGLALEQEKLRRENLELRTALRASQEQTMTEAMAHESKLHRKYRQAKKQIKQISQLAHVLAEKADVPAYTLPLPQFRGGRSGSSRRRRRGNNTGADPEEDDGEEAEHGAGAMLSSFNQGLMQRWSSTWSSSSDARKSTNNNLAATMEDEATRLDGSSGDRQGARPSGGSSSRRRNNEKQQSSGVHVGRSEKILARGVREGGEPAVEALAVWLRRLDTSGDGYVSPKQLYNALMHSSILSRRNSMTEKDVVSLASGFGGRGGKVSHPEFLQAVYDMLDSMDNGYHESREQQQALASTRFDSDRHMPVGASGVQRPDDGPGGGDGGDEMMALHRVRDRILKAMPAVLRASSQELVETMEKACTYQYEQSYRHQHAKATDGQAWWMGALEAGEAALLRVGAFEAVLQDTGVALQPKELRLLFSAFGDRHEQSVDCIALTRFLASHEGLAEADAVATAAAHASSPSARARARGKAQQPWWLKEEVRELAQQVRGLIIQELNFETLQEVFMNADSDGNGLLDRVELAKLLLGLGIGLSQDGAILLVQAMDEDGNGAIDYREFFRFVVEGGAEDEDAEAGMPSARKSARGSPRKTPRKGAKGAWYAGIGELANFLREYFSQDHPELECPLWHVLLHLCREADPDTRGYLGGAEFAALLLQVGLELEDDYTHALLDALDVNGDGRLDYAEFVRFMSEGELSEERQGRAPARSPAKVAQQIWYDAVSDLASKLRRDLWLEDPETGAPRWRQLRSLFADADEDRNGYLNRREFQALLRTMGVRLTTSEASQLMSALDCNGDGRLSYIEFLDFITADHEGGAMSPSRGGGSRSARSARGSARGRSVTIEAAGTNALAKTAVALSPGGQSMRRRQKARLADAERGRRSREGAIRGSRGKSPIPASRRGRGPAGQRKPNSRGREPEMMSAQATLREHCAGISGKQMVKLFERDDRRSSGFVTVPEYKAVIELIGGRYPLKKDEHIALLTTFSTNDHGDGIRRVKYRALARFICG